MSTMLKINLSIENLTTLINQCENSMHIKRLNITLNELNYYTEQFDIFNLKDDSEKSDAITAIDQLIDATTWANQEILDCGKLSDTVWDDIVIKAEKVYALIHSSGKGR